MSARHGYQPKAGPRPNPPNQGGGGKTLLQKAVETAAALLPDDNANPKDRLGIKKVPLSLFPMVALVYGALAFMEGARKYGEFNWRNKPVKRRVYLEAILRHTLQALAGEDIDEDTVIRDDAGNVTFPGIPHEAKIIACAAIILDANESGCLIDDRFEKDETASVMKRFTAGDYHEAAAKITRTPARTLDEVRKG